ncbi:MAG: DUF1540 domain-containing protein [Bacteriovorax sp.]|nr:DUF1540 domain-containing protein [Bacteriovorax sp.]
MEKVTIEMPLVSSCDVSRCGFNVNHTCHAKAITVGDNFNPGCDTFFETNEHNKENKRIAGVGACKVNTCKHNIDFECTAESIVVGFSKQKINCLTFTT